MSASPRTLRVNRPVVMKLLHADSTFPLCASAAGLRCIMHEHSVNLLIPNTSSLFLSHLVSVFLSSCHTLSLLPLLRFIRSLIRTIGRRWDGFAGETRRKCETNDRTKLMSSLASFCLLALGRFREKKCDPERIHRPLLRGGINPLQDPSCIYLLVLATASNVRLANISPHWPASVSFLSVV